LPATIFSQENRVIKINTPLGKDVLLLKGFSGQEAISSLFQFHLDLIAENRQNVAFDKLLGQKVSIEVMLPDEKKRYFHGIVSSFSQGGRGERFTTYRAEMVPQFWLLTRRVQSRIFQQISIPDILKKVLQGVDVAFELQGKYEPRDYCVQYRESDFQFASRLMEEEGIYYFFKHAENQHKMVVADSPQSHPDMMEMSKIIYEEVTGGTRDEERITRWEKVQELRSGKYTLWDHCFELPYKHLEAEKTVLESLSVGKVAHKLKVGGNDKLEIYDFPGAYAQRFDGVDPGGGERPADLPKVFEDNKRTVSIRMQQETLPALEIIGESNCRNLVSGYKFTLTDHFNADGQYVVTSISHVAQHEIGSGVGIADTHYSNDFTCIPFALQFRPQRVTPRPVLHGSQTAEVVGPKGEEIFTDKYGRVKVQFHWDREGKKDANSSCWIRVASGWAAKSWGMVQIPRIGQEVVVTFLEGDPDQPLIVGCVYNADQMPAYKLPDNKVMGGWKSNTSPGGGGSNEVSFNDTKGKEMVTIHAQYNMGTTVEHDDTQTVHNNRTIDVDGTHTETIKKDTAITVTDGKETNTVKQQIDITSQTAFVHVTASTEIQLLVGASKLLMKSNGDIELTGVNITINGSSTVTVKGGIVHSEAVSENQTTGAIVLSEGSATNTIKGGMVMLNP
jgi:type VI secretion system secreted protein VgrG